MCYRIYAVVATDVQSVYAVFDYLVNLVLDMIHVDDGQLRFVYRLPSQFR